MTAGSNSGENGATASAPGGRLRFQVERDAEAMSVAAAALLEQEIRRRPDLLFCAAAGSSPRRAYRLLGQSAARAPLEFSRWRVVKLDEWGGLPMDHPATCETDLRENLLGPANVAAERFHTFQSDAVDPQRECDRVAQWLARHGPIDVCVLGLGTNGHLAMNEPDDALVPQAHVARLTPESLQHPMLATCLTKPTFGLTLGLGELLCSRKILLLVAGSHKRAALARLRQPRVSTRFPASFLWLHPDATVLCDQEAAGDLERGGKIIPTVGGEVTRL